MKQLVHKVMASKNVTLTIHAGKNTFQWMAKNKQRVAASIAIDILFIFLYGLITFSYFDKLTEYVVALGAAIARHAVLNPSSTAGFFDILRETGTTSLFYDLLLLFALLIISVYILYCIFGGSAWWLARGSVEEQRTYTEYIKQFAKVSIFWGLFIVAGHLFSYGQQLLGTIKAGSIPPMSWFIVFYFFLIGYFSSISYTKSHQQPWQAIRSSIRIGIMEIKQLALPVIALLAGLIVVDIMLLGAAKISAVLLIILGFILVFPLMTIARVFFSQVMEIIEKESNNKALTEAK